VTPKTEYWDRTQAIRQAVLRVIPDPVWEGQPEVKKGSPEKTEFVGDAAEGNLPMCVHDSRTGICFSRGRTDPQGGKGKTGTNKERLAGQGKKRGVQRWGSGLMTPCVALQGNGLHAPDGKKKTDQGKSKTTREGQLRIIGTAPSS